MKKITQGIFCLAVIVMFLAPAAMAQNIVGSQHDLTAGGTSQGGGTAATTEVCVFCHTPHGSNTGITAPLWNKTDPGTTYTRYSSLGSATLDGAEVTIGSVSLACLSCHDGTQAMDVVINAPGSGGYNALGAEIDGVAVGAMTGAPVPMLGNDLTNDHPISIEYAGGSCTNVLADCTPAAATGDPDFAVAQYASLNGQNAWWVDVSTVSVTGTPNVREKTDMILYTRTFGANPGPSVECGSCHDPHVDAGGTNVAFMRIQNANSDVCLSCHVK